MKKAMLLVVIVSLFAFIGCAAHVHEIGKGATGSDYEEARQWYILYGLVPINEVDTADMAAGATDYTITTQVTPVDFVINLFTSVVTVNSRTVSVEK